MSVDAIILRVEEETEKVFWSPAMTDRAAVGFVKSVCMDMIFLKNESGPPTLNCFRLPLMMICTA